jgi:outer membrane protein TolC
MSLKKHLCFLLFFVFFLQQYAKSQVSIIPDLSDTYVNRLIDTAKKNYPRIRTYQNRINIANSVISKTRMGLFNSLTVSYVYQPGTTTVNPVTPATSYFQGFQAGIFLNLGSLLSQPYLIRQAKEDLLIAHNDQDEYFITLATEVKKMYYLYVQRLAELKLQIKSTQDMESSLKDVKYRFEKGEDTFENYNKFQLQYTDQQQFRIQAEANLFIAKADLEGLLGTTLEKIK